MNNVLNYELIGWPAPLAEAVHSVLSQDRKHPARHACAKADPQAVPDLSLIYADSLPFCKVAAYANASRGAIVLLAGSQVPNLGLPVIPAGFTATDLHRHYRWLLTESAISHLSERTFPATRDFCTSTLPMAIEQHA